MEKIQKSRRKTIPTILLIVLSCMVLCIIAYMISFKECFLWTCPPHRNFDVLDVGIPESFYPPQNYLDEMKESDIKGSYTDANHVIIGSGGELDIVYSITRFKQIRFAEQGFISKKTDGEIRLIEIDTTNAYRPHHATEYFYECGEFQTYGYMCYFIGWYEEFVIYYMSDPISEVDQVNTVVQYLDERMGKLLSGGEVDDWRLIQGPYWDARGGEP